MNRSTLRLLVLLVVVFTAGFLAGQLTMSAHVRAAAEAEHLTLIEGTLRTDESLRQLEQLQALDYVDGTLDEQAEVRGVEIHDRDRACPGANLLAIWRMTRYPRTALDFLG